MSIKKSRLSIDLPTKMHNKLNELLGGWRIKRALYEKITYDLIVVLEKLDEEQRKHFIVSIVYSYIEPKEYSPTLRKIINESETKDETKNKD